MKMGQDRLAANLLDRRHVATHASKENREKKDEEMARQPRIANV